MKWTILVGILGVVIGFLLGRLEVDEKEGAGPEIVVEKSVRRGRIGGSRSGERDVRKSERREGERLMEEVELMGGVLSEISKARLMKWILELEAGDFPRVLEDLEKLSTSVSDDPFASGPGVSDYLTVALARWYELEGEMALDWVVAKPEILGTQKAGPLLQDVIQDGYQKDPTLAFQLLKKYADVIKDGAYEAGISASWFYQAGRWSRNVAEEFGELQVLVAEFGAVDVDSDPFADDDGLGEERSFIEGMVAAGRGEEVRELFVGNEELLAELDSIVEGEKLAQLEKQGWQNIKAAIDRNEIGVGLYQAQRVLHAWAEKEPAKAVDWFLSQDDGGSRSSQIATALRSRAFRKSSSASDEIRWDVDGATDFLKRLEKEGEPVQEVWEFWLDELSDDQQWESLEGLESKVSAEVWQDFRNTMVEDLTSNSRLNLGQGGLIEFVEIQENQEVILERFGLKEEAMQGVAEKNEKALRELHQRLGVE